MTSNLTMSVCLFFSLMYLLGMRRNLYLVLIDQEALKIQLCKNNHKIIHVIAVIAAAFGATGVPWIIKYSDSDGKCWYLWSTVP